MTVGVEELSEAAGVSAELGVLVVSELSGVLGVLELSEALGALGVLELSEELGALGVLELSEELGALGVLELSEVLGALGVLELSEELLLSFSAKAMDCIGAENVSIVAKAKRHTTVQISIRNVCLFIVTFCLAFIGVLLSWEF